MSELSPIIDVSLAGHIKEESVAGHIVGVSTERIEDDTSVAEHMWDVSLGFCLSIVASELLPIIAAVSDGWGVISEDSPADGPNIGSSDGRIIEGVVIMLSVSQGGSCLILKRSSSSLQLQKEKHVLDKDFF